MTKRFERINLSKI